MIEILNSSKCLINNNKEYKKFLTIKKKDIAFNKRIQYGLESPYEKFYSLKDDKLEIDLGHLNLLKPLGLEYEEPKLAHDLSDEFIENLDLPFTPRPYQVQAAKESLDWARSLNIMCTGSGKSLTISIILEYFRSKGLKGFLVVPNINLLTQFKKDIKSYKLSKLFNCIGVIGGSNNNLKDITITTWQSLKNLDVTDADFIICDEVHKFSSQCTAKLVQDTINAKYKIGFTGTLPSDNIKKMKLIGLFSLPKTFITSQELIDQDLGTPIEITPIEYAGERHYGEYLDRVKQLNNVARNQFVSRLAKRLSTKGPTLVLYTLIEHGEAIYKELTKESEDVFFMCGALNAQEREKIREILEENENSILVANYALLSTGVNIKKLRNLVFASPMKSYITITQSLGRGIRKADNKTIFEVYDIIDNGFKSQFFERVKVYKKSSFKVKEIIKVNPYN